MRKRSPLDAGSRASLAAALSARAVAVSAASAILTGCASTAATPEARTAVERGPGQQTGLAHSTATTLPVRTASTATPSPTSAVVREAVPPVCATHLLRARTVGGGAGLGHLSAVIGLFTTGPRCTLSGWPDLTAVTDGGVTRSSRHIATTPAVNSGAAINIQRIVTLDGATGAYLVVDASDFAARKPSTSCPSYQRFVITLPGSTGRIALPTTAPNFARRFPDCGPVSTTPLVRREDLTVTPFNK